MPFGCTFGLGQSLADHPVIDAWEARDPEIGVIPWGTQPNLAGLGVLGEYTTAGGASWLSGNNFYSISHR